MKIAVHAAEAVRAMLDAPAPFDTGQLYLFEELLIDKLKGERIVVDQSHDAFAVSQEITDPSGIESGRIEFCGVDLDKVIREGKGPGKIPIRGDA